MDWHIDLAADLNAEDDEGLGWSTLCEARHPARIRPGVMLVAGNRQAQAVVRVVAIDDDGQVHFTVLPGSVEKNRHLIGRALVLTAQHSARSNPAHPIVIADLAQQTGQASRSSRTGPILATSLLPDADAALLVIVQLSGSMGAALRPVTLQDRQPRF